MNNQLRKSLKSLSDINSLASSLQSTVNHEVAITTAGVVE